MAVRSDVAAATAAAPIDLSTRRVPPEAEDDAEWVRAARPMLERIAARFARRLPPSLSTDDLVGAGFVALLKMKRRHPTLALVELDRLSASCVRGAMLDEMRQNDPLSRRTRLRAKQIDQITTSFEAREGRAPSEAELGAALGVSRATAATVLRVADSAARHDTAADPIERVPSTDGLGPEDATHRRERLSRVQQAVVGLPLRQQRIVALYFGNERTLRQIGDELGVTEARISQLLTGAVKELRMTCASKPPPTA